VARIAFFSPARVAHFRFQEVFLIPERDGAARLGKRIERRGSVIRTFGNLGALGINSAAGIFCLVFPIFNLNFLF
jgi:hypothetical protein